MSEPIVLQVAGMDCAGCEQRAQNLLRRVDGVTDATADHHTGQVTALSDASLVDRDKLTARITARLAAAGFEPLPEDSS